MAKFFSDFSEYTPDAQPSDWTGRWNTGTAVANVRNSGIPGTPSTGGSHALEVVKSANGIYALSWDDVGTPTGDVQLLVLCYLEDTVDDFNQLWSVLHGAGAAGSEEAYLSEFDFGSTNEVEMLRLSASGAVLGDVDEGLTRNQWIWVRLDRSSDTIRTRAWADGSAEPGTWSVSVTDTTHSSGWIGLGANRTGGSNWFAQIGIGTGGDAAPSEPVVPEISSVTPSEFADGDTGVTIAGSGFEASQGTGKVELGDSSDYATATLVAQTVTSWSDTSIDFTVDQGALSLGDVWAFVTNDSGSTTDPGTAATLINDGTIAATFPSLAGAASGTQTQEGTTAASLPSLSASASGVVAEFVGSIDVTLPSLSGSATGAQAQEGTVEATLPSLTGSATGNQPFTGDMAATLPSLAASISGTANFHDATVSAVLPSLTGSITAAQVFTGTITATLPSLTGHARHGLLSEYLPPGRAIKRVPPPGTVFFR